MTTYAEAVRDFDHQRIAELPGYPELRRVLNDLSEVAGLAGVTVAELLEAARDMTATTPFGDRCQRCGTLTWPHAAQIDGGGQMTGQYRCGCVAAPGWTCQWWPAALLSGE